MLTLVTTNASGTLDVPGTFLRSISAPKELGSRYSNSQIRTTEEEN